jgi:tetratricopeptide (TPR) repeat protein
MTTAVLLLLCVILILTHQRNKDWQNGVALWGHAVQQQGYAKTRGFYNLGLAYQRRSVLADAVRNYSRALELDKDHVSAYTNRGNAYDDLGMPDKAVADYLQALRLSPDDDYLYYNLGVTYRRMGKELEAASSFDKACSLGNALACRARQD